MMNGRFERHQVKKDPVNGSDADSTPESRN